MCLARVLTTCSSPYNTYEGAVTLPDAKEGIEDYYSRNG